MIEEVLMEIVANNGIAGAILVVMGWLIHQNTKALNTLAGILYEMKGRMDG